MAAPALTVFEQGSTDSSGTEITSSSQISFGVLAAGSTSDIITIDIWNDRGDVAGSDNATPRLSAFAAYSPAQDDLFGGTESNGYVSMIEARSCGAYGVAGDYQSAWSKLSANGFLEMGELPSNCKRVIELRIVTPYDADPITEADFNLQLHY